MTRPCGEGDGFPDDNRIDRINRYPCLDDEWDLPVDSEDWKVPAPGKTPSMNSLYHDILSHYRDKDHVKSYITDNPIDCTWVVRRFVLRKWVAYLNHLHTCFWHCRGDLFTDPGENVTEQESSDRDSHNKSSPNSQRSASTSNNTESPEESEDSSEADGPSEGTAELGLDKPVEPNEGNDYEVRPKLVSAIIEQTHSQYSRQ